jgi:hypothetical protein
MSLGHMAGNKREKPARTPQSAMTTGATDRLLHREIDLGTMYRLTQGEASQCGRPLVDIPSNGQACYAQSTELFIPVA